MLRRLVILILLFATTLAPAPPPLTATWAGVGRARVSWSGAGCLYHDRVLYTCSQKSGVVLIGGPQTDGRYRPHVGSVFTLVRDDGTHERARLIGRVWLPVWLPVWRGK